jgi:site-specific recombinase XerD
MSGSVVRLPLRRAAHSDGALAAFHEELFARYTQYCECLNFAPSTTVGYQQFVRNALKELGLSYVWQIGVHEVRRYNLLLIKRRLALLTRHCYCAAIRSIFEFLEEECADEIQARTGFTPRQPISIRTAPRARFGSSFDAAVPPSRNLVRQISRGLRERARYARVPHLAARDLVVFETLYLTAMRANELRQLDVGDLYPGKGPQGQIHIRIGKGAFGSGPRARWIPMLDGLADLLDWYTRKVRPRLRSRRGDALFLSKDGKRLAYSDVRDILRRILGELCVRKGRLFGLHALRHARATQLFESGLDLVAIQMLLGHQFVATTQRYVHVNATFVAEAHQRMVAKALSARGS